MSEEKQRTTRVDLGAAASRECLVDRTLEPGDLADALMRIAAGPGVHGWMRDAFVLGVFGMRRRPVHIRVRGPWTAR